MKKHMKKLLYIIEWYNGNDTTSDWFVDKEVDTLLEMIKLAQQYLKESLDTEVPNKDIEVFTVSNEMIEEVYKSYK